MIKELIILAGSESYLLGVISTSEATIARNKNFNVINKLPFSYKIFICFEKWVLNLQFV